MRAVLGLGILAAVIALALSAADYNNGDGQPQCTETNSNQKFRNNWDPTRYWLCDGEVGSNATSVPCPSETGFQDSLKECVSWDDWKWEPFENPPTAESFGQKK